ncbi:hypothetical protein QCA50_006749 [Cerrena zonata]|uniref:Transmembrane protein n=1 Tax=Cerrena zonata TaxID=2478898 RepID=A0AAW0GJP2_9APHY
MHTRSEGDRHSAYAHTTDDEDEEEDVEAQQQARIVEKQPVDEFDFDGLPPRNGAKGMMSQGSFGYRPRYPSPSQSQSQRGQSRSRQSQYPQPHYPRSHYAQYQAGEKSDGNLNDGVVEEEDGKRPRLLVVLIWMFLSWIQVKCSPGNAADHHMAATAQRTPGPGAGNGAVSEKSRTGPQSQTHLHPNSQQQTQQQTANEKSTTATVTAEKEKIKKKPLSWRESFRRVSQVPAFASPLTPVLNPIVGRAQWEIVVRSAFISAVVCGTVVGALMGVPSH